MNGWKCQKCGREMVALRSTGDIMCFNCNRVVPAFCDEWGILMDRAVEYARKNAHTKTGKKEPKPMKVSYKGVTGKLLKLQHTIIQYQKPYKPREAYILEIADETDGHKHVFENVDVSEIKFIGATVTIA